MEKYDIGIIGAGPAGYTVALRASAKGKKVVLFEKSELGGVCLNKGCIPTKAIIHISELYKEIQESSVLGIEVDGLRVDYKKVISRKDEIVSKLRKGLELAMKNSKIEVVKGVAEIVSENQIVSGGVNYECAQIISATGSTPREIKGMEFDGEFILSSDDVLKMEELPENILIIGSGAIGIEWARIFSNFGVDVHIVEMGENLLPIADIEVSKRIERMFKIKKIKFSLNTKVEKIENKKVVLSTGEELEPQMVLVATGRVSNPQSEISGVKSLGDETNEIQLAHYAIMQGIQEVEGISFRKDLIPSVVYGTPEIAWVGLREQDLEEGTYQKSMLLISALGKSHCDNSTEGFVKLLSQNNKIVGAHIVSKEGSALLQQVLIAMQNDISVDKLKEVCFAHPTFSEGIMDSLWRLS